MLSSSLLVPMEGLRHGVTPTQQFIDQLKLLMVADDAPCLLLVLIRVRPPVWSPAQRLLNVVLID